ncbi:archaemetzincin-2-like [Pomacea canaliculata]|uniref:archaemetzincin-2-like n=1 Tax=Pomacea canaliculata TaxID=400727 RepID=UPI000D73050E|nr:archaemetzincin-2-like [Pomacea canaliculata]
MGASNSSESEIQQSSGAERLSCVDPHFRSLMGKLERLAPAAQRIFSLGKLYFVQGDRDTENDKNEFQALFPSLDRGDSTESKFESGFELFHPLKKSTPPLQHGQTFMQWKAGHDFQYANLTCSQRRRVIYIQPIDDFPDFVKNFRFEWNFQSRTMSVDLFEMLQGFAQIFFSGMDVCLLPKIEMAEIGWDVASRYHQVTGQKQYLVSDFYPHLRRILPPDGACILGLIWTDLFPENFNFVLGEASVKHLAGIFCFGRFPPSSSNAQDLTKITGSIVWKLIKVISHETCHLFGLDHCTFFRCAMNESNSVPEAVDQPLFLCPVCLRKLHQHCGFDVVERYQDLLKFLKDIQVQLPCDSVDSAVKWLENCLKFLNS